MPNGTGGTGEKTRHEAKFRVRSSEHLAFYFETALPARHASLASRVQTRVFVRFH